MTTLFGMFPFLKTLFVDSGYKGPKFAKAVAKVLPHLEIKIVKRSDQVSSFVVLPKRWIVERTIAWLNRCRRLAKDWECLNRKALAFLRLASIRLMLRKLCNPASSLRTDSERRPSSASVIRPCHVSSPRHVDAGLGRQIGCGRCEGLDFRLLLLKDPSRSSGPSWTSCPAHKA